MSIFSSDSGLFGSELEVVSKSENCSVYKIAGGSGDGIMTRYQVFPGIEIIYNDFHTGRGFQALRPCHDTMEINHCRQGRFECELCSGSFVYLEKGDLSVNMIGSRIKHSCFPLEHYHGISVVMELEEASRSISNVLCDISIDLFELREKLCFHDQCFIMRATDSVEHIFSELYRVPDKIKRGYYKLKILELLLFLSVADPSDNAEQRQYFHKDQVETVKAIKEHMIENLECHDTLDELSEHFGIPVTAMKLCFKGVYGTSIYTFLRTYRIHTAAVLLCRSRESISSIAARVGYVNSSKFASAFKDVMGIAPLEYRKGNSLG